MKTETMTPEATNAECARRIGLPLTACEDCGGELVKPQNMKNCEEWQADRDGLLYCENCHGGRTGIPNFHGSMDAAMQLVEFAQNLFWNVTLRLRAGENDATFRNWRTGVEVYAENEHSPSVAICAAFLEIPMP